MKESISKIMFDKRDRDLLKIVNDVLNRDKSRTSLKKLFDPYLHPHGIKEMAAPQSLRIAYAVINLLDSLEMGKYQDRINALRSLRDEILHTAHSSFRNNTARVLLEIMKELVRSRDNYCRQLELAHDFRSAITGKARIVRQLLKRYHLLEMPEEWNQIAFDDHVHDVHTKGRKSATHLIMDAWIKGIRQLTVIYYNYVRAEAAQELLEAAKIMGITARIGIELSARFRDQYVHLIWVPQGFPDVHDFLKFLEEPAVLEFLNKSREVSEYQQKYVYAVLKAFNEKHRVTLNQIYGLNLGPLEESDFLAFVGSGQASLLHLGQFILIKLSGLKQARMEELREKYHRASTEEQLTICRSMEEIDGLDSETIVDQFLRPGKNPSIPNPNIPEDAPNVPTLLKASPSELTEQLNYLHSGYRITLNLSDLKVEDVLELIYDCKGRITHLETFNLKDYATGKAPQYAEISELQQAINLENIIALKRFIQRIISRLEMPAEPDIDRLEKLKEILQSIARLRSYYRLTPLKSRIGSDSTGRSRHLQGMGLVVKETLPYKAQRAIDRSVDQSRQIVPMNVSAHLQETYIPNFYASRWLATLFHFIRLLPGLGALGHRRVRSWAISGHASYVAEGGNIATLGGASKHKTNELCFENSPAPSNDNPTSLRYLNTGVKNSLKVALGFIPAFATFALTKDWWFLAYFGAFIWFGITGLRNILQSVLGGGGYRRSPLLRWNSYVSWERLADSLLYTGFSVPLLDYVTKTLILDRGFNITTATNPDALYSFMALANGIYLSSHNAFRGLPRGAVFGNFFRSILSIPLAILLNSAAGNLLGLAGIQAIDTVLQKWAAVISKTASDCVAGIIEGLADRHVNIRLRLNDYNSKIEQLFDSYANLEVLFPESKVLEKLESQEPSIETTSNKARELEKIMIINSLDLFYFWMYQPRARIAFSMITRHMSNEEWKILIGSQNILHREREISQMFIDGLIGKKFSKALSFYLDRSEEYLQTMSTLSSKHVSDKENFVPHDRFKIPIAPEQDGTIWHSGGFR